MTQPFNALLIVKHVLIMHLLRQQVEADLKKMRSTPLHLLRCYDAVLNQIHADLLKRIGECKRQLKRHGVRIVTQQKNSLDFQITYVEKGYEVQHCFLLATLQAESHVLFHQYLEGGSYDAPR